MSERVVICERAASAAGRIGSTTVSGVVNDDVGMSPVIFTSDSGATDDAAQTTHAR